MTISHHLVRRGAAAALLGGCAALAFGGAQPAVPRYGVAVYSDLCIDPASGDIGGQRITVHRFAEGDSIVYEYTAGALSMPVLGGDVDINDRTGVLTFNVADQSQAERTIIGRFTDHGRTLTLQGGYCADASLPMRLARVSDFARKLPSCKACPPGQEVAPADTPAPSTVPAKKADDAADDSPTLEQQEMLLQAQPLKKYDVPPARPDARPATPENKPAQPDSKPVLPPATDGKPVAQPAQPPAQQ